MKIKEVYYLEHFYDIDDDITMVTDIGVYSTMEKAKAAMKKFKKHPKFRDHPNDFNIDRYEINKATWAEGFFICN